MSGNRCSKNQVRFRHDESSALDDEGEYAGPKCLLRVKHTKEAHFYAGVVIAMKDGVEVDTHLRLLSHTKKIFIAIKE